MKRLLSLQLLLSIFCHITPIRICKYLGTDYISEEQHLQLSLTLDHRPQLSPRGTNIVAILNSIPLNSWTSV